MNAKIPLKPYSTHELSKMYYITEKTMLKWLQPFQQEIGEKVGWYFNVRQVEIIFEKLGWPDL